jgi:hypothetical protein
VRVFATLIALWWPAVRIAAAPAVGSALAALAAFAAWSAPSQPRGVSAFPAKPLVAVDWQGPLSLPPRFRNHCRFDFHRHRWYCANHCGTGYQFYFCSPASFGCCHPGYGYCDWKGHLRCAP